MADSQGGWSRLPNDLLLRIHNSLSGCSIIYPQILRAVCPAWRAAIPPAGDECRLPPPLSPLQVPLFFYFSDDPLMGSHNLLPHDTLQVKSNLLVSSDEPDEKWIIQVQQTGPDKLSLFNPLTGNKLQFPPGVNLDHVNLLEYRIIDLGTSLSLRSTDVISRNSGLMVSNLRKLIAQSLIPGSFVLMALSDHEILRFWQPGMEKWSDFYPAYVFGDGLLSDDLDAFSGGIKDIVSFKEMFYAVDGVGRLLMFDPSSWQEPVIVVPGPLIEGEEKAYFVYMYLIVSEGSLYLVVRIKEALRFDTPRVARFQVAPTVIRVYVLKEETGKESGWAEVKSIGDQVFFVGRDSNFSISSSHHGWNIMNRIYFGGIMGKSIEFDLEYGLGAGIYDLCSSHFVQFDCWADHSVYTRLFWPPPRWVAPNANLDPEMDPYEWLHRLKREGTEDNGCQLLLWMTI